MSSVRFVHRFALAAALALGVLLSTSAPVGAFELWPYDLPKQPQPYVLEGYLDKAPAGTKILDDIQITVNKKERKLLITSYGYGEITLDLHLSRNLSSTYSIRGSKEDLEQLAGAPAGARIEGTFAAYTDGPPWLLIAELNFPAENDPPKSAS